MKRLSIFVLVLIAALFVGLAPQFSSPAGADTGPNTRPRLDADALYQVDESGWSGSSVTSDTIQGWGDDQWQLTLAHAQSVSITVTDCCIVGDNYEVYIDGTLIGTTPPEPLEGPTYSEGTFARNVSAGTHLITIRDAGGIQYYNQGATYMIPAGYDVSIAVQAPTTTIEFLNADPEDSATINQQIDAFSFLAVSGWIKRLEHRGTGVQDVGWLQRQLLRLSVRPIGQGVEFRSTGQIDWNKLKIYLNGQDKTQFAVISHFSPAPPWVSAGSIMVDHYWFKGDVTVKVHAETSDGTTAEKEWTFSVHTTWLWPTVGWQLAEWLLDRTIIPVTDFLELLIDPTPVY